MTTRHTNDDVQRAQGSLWGAERIVRALEKSLAGLDMLNEPTERVDLRAEYDTIAQELDVWTERVDEYRRDLDSAKRMKADAEWNAARLDNAVADDAQRAAAHDRIWNNH